MNESRKDQSQTATQIEMLRRRMHLDVRSRVTEALVSALVRTHPDRKALEREFRPLAELGFEMLSSMAADPRETEMLVAAHDEIVADTLKMIRG